jgi:hypothetical protein
MGIVLTGCRTEDPIVRHEIPKDRSGLDHLRQSASQADQGSLVVSTVASDSTEQDRMVVALAMRDDATWFFKINGPVSRINETEDQWLSFLKRVSFDDDGKPIWKLPEGWKVGNQKPMRFATLIIDSGKPQVELAISSLSAGQDLLLNVNRWRGQLGLDSTDEKALKNSLSFVQADGQKLTLFDETGKMSGSMMPPFARAGGTSQTASDSAGGKVRYVVPEGWQAGRPSPFLKARFSRTEGEQSAQISVSSLPAAANKWLPNAKRWAGQVGMSSLSESELAERTSEITVDEHEGKLIRLVPEEAKQENATIAVMVKKGANAWFFKLTGDRKIVDASDEALMDFLGTVKLP